MLWDFVFLGGVVVIFFGVFYLLKWGRETRTPERRNPLNFMNPGSGGA